MVKRRSKLHLRLPILAALILIVLATPLFGFLGTASALTCPPSPGADPNTGLQFTPTLNGSNCQFQTSEPGFCGPDNTYQPAGPGSSFCTTSALPDNTPPPVTPPGQTFTCTNPADTPNTTTGQCEHPIDPNAADPALGCKPPYTRVGNSSRCGTAPVNSVVNNGCAGSDAPANTNCAIIPAGCPGSTNKLPAGTPAPDLSKCPFRDPNAAANGEEQQDDCPVAKNQELRWLYCPIFYGMATLTNTLDAFINEYLTTGNKIFNNTSTVDGKPDENGYKTAWTTFRNFGIALVIIAGLVMLVSEAFGLQFIDAYTVRKVLPRLLIAVVGISLSWELCKFIVGFFDTLGRAMGSIIYTSFGIGDQGIEIWALIVANLLAGAAVAGAALLLTGLGLLSLLGTLILAMLVGAAVLILRQAIIVAAVILAPLAIAAYILPNTSKLANFWWDTFTKMLMLYPIATGLIALCKVMGKIAMTNPGGTGGDTAIGDLIATVSGIIFFFAGYALLPVAFRLTGGLVATIGGLANDKTRGGFDRLKNYRKGRMEDSVGRLKSGERFKGNNALSSGFNNFSRGASAFAGARYKGAFLTNKTARSTAMAEHDELMRQQHAKSAAGIGNMFNDDSLRAQASGRTEAEARRNLKNIYGMEGKKADDAIAMAKANGGFSAIRQQNATTALAATGTGYDNLGQMAQQIALTAGGNEGRLQTMVGAMRGAASKSGRYDLGAAGHSTVAGLAQESMRSGGQAAPSPKSVRKALYEAGRSTTNNQLASAKPKAVSEIANATAVTMNVAQSEASKATSETQRVAFQAQAAEAAAKISNMRGAAPFATEVVLEAMNTGKTTASGDVIVAGNIAFENPAVERTVNIIQTQAGENKMKVVMNDDGTPRLDDRGQKVMAENAKYKPELQSYRRNSTTRVGPIDPTDTRYNQQQPVDEDQAA